MENCLQPKDIPQSIHLKSLFRERTEALGGESKELARLTSHKTEERAQDKMLDRSVEVSKRLDRGGQ
jgi:hypothetical protein